MGTRRSRHNKGRKPLYKEHGSSFVTDDQIYFANETRSGTAPEIDGAFLRGPLATGLSLAQIEPLTETAASELFKQIRYAETNGDPVCPLCKSRNIASYTRLGGASRYRCRSCTTDFSSTSGTPFSSPKLGMLGVLREIAVSVGMDRDATVHDVSEESGLGVKTVVEKRKLFRDYMFDARNERETPNMYALGHPRYVGGLLLSTRTRWTDAEKDALIGFVERKANPEDAAIALGRTASSIGSYARDICSSSVMTAEWKLLAGIKYKPRDRKEIEVALQFPYIRKAREDHADILAVNAMVPRSLPPHMRADVVQEIMLAMLEGRTSLEELRDKQKNVRWFVTQFYRDNFEQSGHAVSLTQEGDNGDEYNILESKIAKDDWDWQQMNDKRNAWDQMNFRAYAPTQIDEVYHIQVRNEQRRNHHEGLLLDYVDAEKALALVDPKTMRHMDNDYKIHAMDRLRERYGLVQSKEIFKEILDALYEGRVRITGKGTGGPNDHALVGWVRAGGRNIRILFDPNPEMKNQFITILPPQDDTSKNYQRTARDKAEAIFR